jgi:hypothetical protein
MVMVAVVAVMSMLPAATWSGIAGASWVQSSAAVAVPCRPRTLLPATGRCC